MDLKLHRLAILPAVLVAVAFCLPATAAAQGNSGVDQYTEGIPGSGGEKPTGKGGNNGKGGNVNSQTQAALEASGSDGAALLGLAEATAPNSAALRRAARQASSSKGNDKGNGNASAGEEPGSGGIAGIADAAAKGTGLAALADAATGDGDSGMGVAFPLVLLLAAIVAGAYAVTRVRRS